MNLSVVKPHSKIFQTGIFMSTAILVILLGFVDRWLDVKTGTDLPFIIFFLIPVGITAWFTGKKAGLIISIISAIALFLSDTVEIHEKGGYFIPLWSGVTGFLFCYSFAFILAELKKEIKIQVQSAMEDFLTKASNARAFYNYATIEVNRIQRYNKPMTLVYLDIDDFKKINDTMGHMEGDRLLITVASVIRSNIRKTDAVARLGGDEFAILLPEMSAAYAEPFLKHIRGILCEEMKKSGWSVTFSAGVLTFVKPPQSIDEMIKAADGLMYDAKNHGKNNSKYGVYQ